LRFSENNIVVMFVGDEPLENKLKKFAKASKKVKDKSVKWASSIEDQASSRVTLNMEQTMIKHIVCWKLKNRSLPIDKNEDALLIKKTLENLMGKIPGLLHIEVGFDYSGTESAGDIVLYSELESKEALANYQIHPAHVAAGTIVRPRTCERRMIDYGYEKD